MSSPAAVATPATESAPAAARTPRVKAEPVGLPILPAKGRISPLTEKGSVVIATRTHVGTAEAPATRAFVGPHPASWKPGTRFLTHHGKNGLPCGEFTIDAIVTDGAVKGKLPEGKFSQLVLVTK